MCCSLKMSTEQNSSVRKRRSDAALLTFRRWQFCISVGVYLIFGLICGHLLYILAFSNDIYSNFYPIQQIKPKFVRSDLELKRVHEPPSESKGLDRKKDMSIQFRDYQPKMFFINIGGTLPTALHLFLETYPDATSYELFSFISNSSFSVYYDTFQNHTLFSPVEFCSINGKSYSERDEDEENNDTNAKRHHSSSEEQSKQNIRKINITNWIQNNIHEDDYVIMKIESPDELLMLQQLVETGTIEWIDKYYSVSTSADDFERKRNITSVYNMEIYKWDDENGTYSDFSDINPARVPPVAGLTIEKCKTSKDESEEQFGLFFYAKKANGDTKSKLEVLTRFAEQRKMKPGLFLSIDILSEYPLFSNELFGIFHGGLYDETLESLSSAPGKQYFTLRNTVVRANHITERFPKHMILQYFFLRNISNKSMIDRLMKERHTTVFTGAKDISSYGNILAKGEGIEFPTGTFAKGNILSINLDGDNADAFAIYMMKQYEKQIVSLVKCAIPEF